MNVSTTSIPCVTVNRREEKRGNVCCVCVLARACVRVYVRACVIARQLRVCYNAVLQRIREKEKKGEKTRDEE